MCIAYIIFLSYRLEVLWQIGGFQTGTIEYFQTSGIIGESEASETLYIYIYTRNVLCQHKW